MKELWLPVVGYEGLYEVSNLGRVRSVERTVETRKGVFSPLKAKIMSPTISRGYLRLHLYKKGKSLSKYVHVLVAEAFIGAKPQGLQTLHGIRGKLCNEPANLSYGTAKENAADRKRDGTEIVGEKMYCAKLTEKSVNEIRNSSLSCTELAVLYGVTEATLYKAKTGRSWTHI